MCIVLITLSGGVNGTVRTEEKAYWNKDVARIVGIGESTVRKWCIELEKNGYKFIRGFKDSRAFLQHDLNAMIYFKSLVKDSSYSFPQAAEMVVSKYGGEKREGENDITAPVLPEKPVSMESIEQILGKFVTVSEEQMQNAKVMNEELLKRLEKQNEIMISLGLIIEEQNKMLKNARELYNLLTLREHLQYDIYHIERNENTNSTDDEADQEKIKKKRPIERIKSFFKK